MGWIWNNPAILAVVLISLNVGAVKRMVINSDGATSSRSKSNDGISEKYPDTHQDLHSPKNSDIAQVYPYPTASQPSSQKFGVSDSNLINLSLAASSDISLHKDHSGVWASGPSSAVSSGPELDKFSKIYGRSDTTESNPKSQLINQNLRYRRSSINDDLKVNKQQHPTVYKSTSSGMFTGNGFGRVWNAEPPSEQMDEPWALGYSEGWMQSPKEHLFNVVRRKSTDVSRRQAPHVRGRIDPAMRYMGIGKRVAGPAV